MRRPERPTTVRHRWQRISALLGAVALSATLVAGCSSDEPAGDDAIVLETGVEEAAVAAEAEATRRAESLAEAQSLLAEREAAAELEAEAAEAEATRQKMVDAIELASPDTVIPPGSMDVYYVEPGAFTRTLTDIRVGRHEGFDRVVFDLGGDPDPGWWAYFTLEAQDDGSGDPVSVPGDHVLVLRLSGMVFPEETDLPSFDGGPVLLGGESINSVVPRFWHEGNRTVFIGINGEAQPQVKITALDNPARVVVDVSH